MSRAVETGLESLSTLVRLLAAAGRAVISFGIQIIEIPSSSLVRGFVLIS